MGLRLIVFDCSGDSEVLERVIPLGDGETLWIGRSPSCKVQLQQRRRKRFVARRQCDIETQNGTARLIDYGGTSSALHFGGLVAINGRRLMPEEEWNELKPGDEIQIGDWKLFVEIGPDNA